MVRAVALAQLRVHAAAGVGGLVVVAGAVVGGFHGLVSPLSKLLFINSKLPRRVCQEGNQQKFTDNTLVFASSRLRNSHETK